MLFRSVVGAMRTHPARTGVLGFRPSMVLIATATPELPMTSHHLFSQMPMMFCVFKSFHQNPLHLVTVEQPQLSTYTLLLRLRLFPNHFCRFMHWYELKKSKARSLPRKRCLRFRQFPVLILPTLAAAGAKNAPAFGPGCSFPDSGRLIHALRSPRNFKPRMALSPMLVPVPSGLIQPRPSR